MDIAFSDKVIPPEWQGHFDMLHDRARNRAYARGLQTVIESYSSYLEKNDLLFCDIGCGSGLLSCLVAKCHKNIKVVAFETVEALADIARETVVRNGLCDQVFVFNMHTSIIDDNFMMSRFGRRANGIVSELLDTGFMGEGLISGLNHANSCILSAASLSRERVEEVPRIMSPIRGRVYVQGWSGECLRKMQQINIPLRLKGSLRLPDSYCSCPGICTPMSLHVRCLQMYDPSVRPVTEPQLAFNYSFATKMPEESSVCLRLSTSVSSTDSHGTRAHCDAIVLFWECDMIDSEDNVGNLSKLSSVPGSPPPDHWRQSVYFLPNVPAYSNDNPPQDLETDGSDLLVRLWHDKDDIWLRKEGNDGIVSLTSSSWVTSAHEINTNFTNDIFGQLGQLCPPSCICGLHTTCDGFRNSLLNEQLCDFRLFQIVSNFISNIEAICCECSGNGKTKLIILVGDNVLLPALLLYQLSTGQYTNLKLVVVFMSKECALTAQSILDATGAALTETGFKCKDQIIVNVVSTTSSDTYLHDFGISDSWNTELYTLLLGTANDGFELAAKRRKMQEEDQCIQFSSIVSLDSYCHYLQSEWSLEHFLQSSRLMLKLSQALRSDRRFCTVHPQPNIIACNLISVWCSLFSSVALWKSCVCPVGECEGVDMSAINELLAPSTTVVTQSCGSDVANCQLGPATSARLSQWNGTILNSSATCIGVVNSSELDNPAFPNPEYHWVQTAKLRVDVTTLGHTQAIPTINGIKVNDEDELCPICNDHSQLLHGICCWTEPVESDDHRGLQLNLTTNPSLQPESIQGIRAFNRPICGNCCAMNFMGKELFLNILATISRDLEFTIGLY